MCEWLNLRIAAVVPNGLATGLDIGLSNYSLSLITLSFYTMCKSTTPIFLLGFCFLWGLERCSTSWLPCHGAKCLFAPQTTQLQEAPGLRGTHSSCSAPPAAGIM